MKRIQERLSFRITKIRKPGKYLQPVHSHFPQIAQIIAELIRVNLRLPNRLAYKRKRGYFLMQTNQGSRRLINIINTPRGIEPTCANFSAKICEICGK